MATRKIFHRPQPNEEALNYHGIAEGRSGRLRSADFPTQTGWLSITPRGFGFVAPANGAEDVFVPPGMMGGALHGDLVEVETFQSAKGTEGRVARVIRRGLRELTGRIVMRSHGPTFDTEDARLPSLILVEAPLTAEVARAARDGHICLAEITHYPTRPDDPPVVSIKRVLGEAGIAQVEVQKIKVRENVHEEFDPELDNELALFTQASLDKAAFENKKRRDIRAIPFLTIDPDDARDHDDAVWAEKIGTGYRVLVAIADVSFFVREGSLLDKTALERGCSLYLPDRAIPMLPDQLSGNLASLKEGVDRLTLAVEIHVSASGHIERTECFEGLMRTKARLTYGQAASALDLTSGLPPGAAGHHIGQLRTLLEISDILRKQRLKNGGLDFDLPEARVKVDPSSGEPIDATYTRQDPGIRRAYQMIEDLMLLANVAVAQALGKAGAPAVFRIHGPPNGRKLEQFAEVAASYGYQISSIEDDRHALRDFLMRIEGRPEAQTLGYLLLRSMDQASYALKNIGHYGLGFSHYVHFTSPIRRYPDLLIHRQVKQYLIERHPISREPDLLEKLSFAAALASRLERRAMTVEREVAELYKTLLMRDAIGTKHHGRISHISAQAFYVALEHPAVEICCRIAELPYDTYALDELGIRWVGRKTKMAYSLGDKIEVEITDISIASRHVYGIPLSRGQAVRTPRKKPKASGGAEKTKKNNIKSIASYPRKNKRGRQPRRKG